MQHERDNLRDKGIEKLENEKAEIREKKEEDHEQMDNIVDYLRDEDEKFRLFKEQKAEEEDAERAKKEVKRQQKDAAAFVERKWIWFQTVGKYLAKKKKKGRKGKKKKN